MSRRDKLILAVAATLVALAGGWFMIAKPKRAEMRSLDGQIATVRTQLAGASARAAQYRAARDQLLRDPQAFREADKALPNRIAMSELLRTLSRTAANAGVQMADLSTSAGTDASPGISSVGLSLTFNGGFLDLQRFLGKLQTLVQVSRQKVAAKGRLLTLDSVSLAPGGTAGASAGLSAKVAATAYILQPGALSATSATPGAATTPGAPAPTPNGATTP